MPKVVVRKSPVTGKLFEDDTKYAAHLRQSRKKRISNRKYTALLQDIDSFLEGEKQCSNAQELCEYVLAHSKEYMIRGAFPDSTKLREALLNGYEIQWPSFTGMKIGRPRWSNSVSNTHSAPRGKETNWGGQRTKEGIPRGYPGWSAQVRIWHEEDARIVISGPTAQHLVKIPTLSDCTRGASGIHTGTGGGRSDGSYYSLELFAEDFPEMEKLVTFHILGGPQTDDAAWNPPAHSVLDAMGGGSTGYIVGGDPF